MDKKVERVISMYNRLQDGEVLVKADEAKRFGVDERSIQRDLEDIRAYLANDASAKRELVYDRIKKGYVLEQERKNLTDSEILTVCKILLESRSLMKEEMYPIIDKLLATCVSRPDYKKVEELIRNEKHHYLEPHHGRKFVDDMWKVGSAVYEKRLMRVRYRKLKSPEPVTRLLQPVAILFSEYYFYLCAYICKSEEMPDVPKYDFPATYRIDRIDEFEILEEHFHVPYAKRFEEGEFRKRIQFMFGGELRRVRFLHKSDNIEFVLDRFPTAQILSHDEKGWLIQAEVYGDGVDIWFRSMGDVVEVLDDGKKAAGKG